MASARVIVFNPRAILLREAAVSAFVNGVLSLIVFLLTFGYRVPPGLHALGRDFLPQAFMVSLMSGLVPALILRRRVGGAIRPILLRALRFALAGTVVAGGGALVLSMMPGDAPVPVLEAIAIKIAFGGVLGAIVTPLALLPLLRSERS